MQASINAPMMVPTCDGSNARRTERGSCSTSNLTPTKSLNCLASAAISASVTRALAITGSLQQAVKLRWRNLAKRGVDHPAYLKQFNVIEATLTGFHLGHIGLRPSEHLSHLPLRPPRPLTGLAEQRNDLYVPLIVDGFFHQLSRLKLCTDYCSCSKKGTFEPKTVYLAK